MKKRFNKGDIVYYVERNNTNGTFEVKAGLVEDHFTDGIIAHKLEIKDFRLIDGMPITEWTKTDYTKVRKIPARYRYEDLRHQTYDEELKSKCEQFISVHGWENPATIMNAINDGIVVRACDQFHGYVEADISKNGYYIRPVYNHYIPFTISLMTRDAFYTYDDARNSGIEWVAELDRVAKLTDNEWAIEQMDKVVDHWVYMKSIPNETKLKVREYLLGLGEPIDYEIRFCNGGIEWRKFKNKRWNPVPESILG